MECLTSNKPFHIGADQDHGPDLGILMEFYDLGRSLQFSSTFRCILNFLCPVNCFMSNGKI